MSKMAVLRQYQMSPAAGGILGTVVKAVGKFVGRGLGIIKPAAAKAAAAAAKAAATPAGQAALYAGAGAAGAALLGGGGKSGGSATWPYATRRRGRGITARELRGYRKVANLLHKEGMVSKRAHRGRSH